MSFISDLEKQVPNVRFVADMVDARIIEGKCKEGDLLLEIKEDLYCKTTGNVALEYMYKGEKSGILAGSHFIVYKIGNTYFRVKTEKLIHWLEENPDKYKKVKGGDGGHSSLVIIKLYWFIQIFEAWFKE